MLQAIENVARERGKEQAVRCAALDMMWQAADEVRDVSSTPEAVEVWRRKQQEWLALCEQDPEVKTCVLRRMVRVVSSELHDLLDSHGVWNGHQD